MRALINVLQRCFAYEFYRLNAMFFFLTFGLTFGFMRGPEHQALAEFIISAPAGILIPLVIWIFYSFKIFTFNNGLEINFIRDIHLLPLVMRIIPMTWVIFLQFLPAVGYGFFLLATAVQHKKYITAIFIIAILVLSMIILTILFHRSLKLQHPGIISSGLKRWMDKKFQKHFVQFFVEWIVRQQPGLILTTKFFGCILLFAITQLYKYEVYDYRLLALGCLPVFGANLILVYHYVLFENHTFSFLRNLPLLPRTRIFYFIFSMLVLILPEIIVMINNFPDDLSWYQFPEIIIFGSAIFIAGYCHLLGSSMRLERFSGIVFSLGGVLIIIILFKVPLITLSLVSLIVSIYNYSRCYNNFEIALEVQSGD